MNTVLWRNQKRGTVQRRPHPLPKCRLLLVLFLATNGCFTESIAGESGREPVVPLSPAQLSPDADIPSPFEPIRLAREQDDLIITVWGRKLRFSRGPLPVHIESQGISLFSKPPVFQLEQGGESNPLSWDKTQVVSASSDQVTLSSQAQAADLSIASTTRVEYDGMIRVDLLVSAPRTLTVDAFYYAVTIPRLLTTYFTHHLEYDYENLRIDKAKLSSSAGLLSAGRRSFPFVPSFSLSNRTVGVEWWSPTNAGWKATTDPIKVFKGSAATQFEVHPIQSSVLVGPSSNWTHRFALFPLPTRPAPAKWRSARFTTWSQARLYDRSVDTRFFWIAFPDHFDARWHGLPRSFSSDRQRAIRQRLERIGVAYIPYAKLTSAPSLHPQTLKNVARWSANDRLFTGTGAAQRQFLESRGWQAGEVFSYSVCVGRTAYLDWMFEESIGAVRSEDLDGLYYDWGAINESCERDRRIQNPEEEQMWHYFELRNFYRRTYEALKEYDPEALLVIHTQGTPKALATYTDFTFVGEGLNVAFRGGADFSVIREKPELYRPDYLALPAGLLDALLFPRVGGISGLLPQVHHARDPKNPERERRWTRALLAQTLANDQKIWVTNLDPDERVQVFRAMDRLGGWSDVTVFPWWDNEEVLEYDERLKATLYLRAKRGLVVIANWNKEAIKSVVRIHGRKAGLGEKFSVRDAETSNGDAIVALGGEFRTSVPGQDLRLYLLEEAKDSALGGTSSQ